MTAVSTPDSYPLIAENIKATRERIEAARAQSPYDREVTLMAVTKTVDVDRINYAIDHCGIRCIGENRVQELCDKYPLLHLDGVSVHLIGSLQSNKVKYIADRVDVIHSLDSERLALEIEKRAAAKGRVIDVLVEINSGREESKSGVLPEQAAALCRTVLTLPHLHLAGFMTMGPVCESEAEYRAYFAETVALGNAIWQSLGLAGEPQYSMGMSQSFPAAIKEGATFVRVGRRLFDGRPE